MSKTPKRTELLKLKPGQSYQDHPEYKKSQERVIRFLRSFPENSPEFQKSLALMKATAKRK
jgi:hypothetical protein